MERFSPEKMPEGEEERRVWILDSYSELLSFNSMDLLRVHSFIFFFKSLSFPEKDYIPEKAETGVRWGHSFLIISPKSSKVSQEWLNLKGKFFGTVSSFHSSKTG